MKDDSPIREATLFILLSLSQGPQHGYAMMQLVAGMSNGRVQLSTGTLYGGIKRLLKVGWIERAGEEVENGRNRKLYRLTEDGRQALATEIERLESELNADKQWRPKGA